MGERCLAFLGHRHRSSVAGVRYMLGASWKSLIRKREEFVDEDVEGEAINSPGRRVDFGYAVVMLRPTIGWPALRISLEAGLTLIWRL